MLNYLFENPKLQLDNITCHSGGALGSDTYWENIGESYGVKTKAYSYKTNYHTSKNKVEISDDDYKDGIDEINKANKEIIIVETFFYDIINILYDDSII